MERPDGQPDADPAQAPHWCFPHAERVKRAFMLES
jgi:hypothetical protein